MPSTHLKVCIDLAGGCDRTVAHASAHGRAPSASAAPHKTKSKGRGPASVESDVENAKASTSADQEQPVPPSPRSYDDEGPPAAGLDAGAHCLGYDPPELPGASVNPALDTEPNAPPWMRLVVGLTALRGCRDLVREKDCVPKVFRNDSVPNGRYTEADGLIRYNLQYFEAQRAKYPVEEDYVAFTLGAIAHEYGHYLDLKAFPADGAFQWLHNRFIESVPVLAVRDYKRAWREELWADCVAGCILAGVSLPDSAFRKFLQGEKPDGTSGTHPPPEARVEALKVGWTRCSSAPVPQALFLWGG